MRKALKLDRTPCMTSENETAEEQKHETGLAKAAHDAGERGEALFEEARAFLRRQWNERPLTVAAAAVGLGALIGLALSKRR